MALAMASLDGWMCKKHSLEQIRFVDYGSECWPSFAKTHFQSRGSGMDSSSSAFHSRLNFEWYKQDPFFDVSIAS
jgi:hypothetical protein